MDTIQGWIDKAGLAETRIERRMMDRSAMAAGRGNWTSAADMEAMLLAIAAGTCVSEGASREMRRVLEAQQIQDRLPRRLPEGVRIANKTGDFADVVHDAGIARKAGGDLCDRRIDTGRALAVGSKGRHSPAWGSVRRANVSREERTAVPLSVAQMARCEAPQRLLLTISVLTSASPNRVFERGWHGRHWRLHVA